MDEPWTLQGVVAEVATRIAALPVPRNGQVRAIPDERTIRYYATIGLLDRPIAMRGRTALYGRRHVAQVVAIKRLQAMGRSLSEIQGLWPTLDDRTLARMSGMELEAKDRRSGRAEFWKREPRQSPAVSITAGTTATESDPAALDVTVGDAAATAAAAAPASIGVAKAAATATTPVSPGAAMAAAATAALTSLGAPHLANTAPVELRLELAPHVVLSLSVDEGAAFTLTPADVRALRAAAAPLLAELASRRLASHPAGEEP